MKKNNKQSDFIKSLNSVVKVIDEKIDKKNRYYIGIKDTDVIPIDYYANLKKYGYIIQTIDKASKNGRAIDVDLINPITGRCMTGSSSGTAINVFLGINDVGIGTDGGGSVLAPACALNLYGFISKNICKDHMSKFKKTSTDGIEFYPSIGYLSKRLDLIEQICRKTIKLKSSDKKLDVKIGFPRINYHKMAFSKVKDKLKADVINLSYQGIDREAMIKELSEFDFDNNILVTFEGPIDLLGYGDSIIGHYGDFARTIQENGHKYYLKVVNMLGLSAIIVPTNNLAVGTLMICKSEAKAIHQLYELARKLEFKRSKLEEKYFSV